MTREEAIAYWKPRYEHIIEFLEKTKDEPSIREYAEALNMAIESLSNNTTKKPNDAIKKPRTVRYKLHNPIEYVSIEFDEEEEVLSANYTKESQNDIVEQKNDVVAEPTELLQDGTLKVNVKNGADVKRVLVWGDDGCGGLYYTNDGQGLEWKLASEELPQSVGSYIVTCKDEHGWVYVDYDYWTVVDEFKYNRSKVTAWIPFPKPYCGTKMGSDTR